MSANSLIIAGYGLNCEEESAIAFERVGFSSQIVHINDLIENPKLLDNFQVLCVPGGFSYGDDTGSGNAFAQKMRLTLQDALKNFVERDTLTIGICNGCQIVVNLGLAPACDKNYGVRQVAVTHNENARYQCRWVDLKVESNLSPWLQNVYTIHVPVAHGEGRFMMDDDQLKILKDNHQIALRYSKDGKAANGEFPYNPNGSTDDIAGITDETGRVLVLMPHPERGMFAWQRDDYTRLKDEARRKGQSVAEESDGLLLFQNAAHYFDINQLKKSA
ncbi:MAG: phosphoribosylformylglycinamidine synthase I [Pseudomonadota bacterium]